ncbi:putative thiamine pyrophosphate-containing protein YdaP [compost metagenome]
MPISRSPWSQVRSSLETTVGDAIIETLIDWGIDTVFGIPGDNADGLMNGLLKNKDRIRFVLVRHEENAAFMATAHYKLTGKIAACLTTAGPGAFHLINGLYEAFHDKIPVLALTGNADSFAIGTDQVQEFIPEKDFAGCTVWARMLAGTKNARIVTSNAIRTAYARSGPALLSVPVDLGLEVLPKEAPKADHQFSPPTLWPDPERLEPIIAAIDRAERPMIMIGRGTWGLGHALVQLADKLGAPIVKALWGKESVSDDDPHVLGGLGLIGTRPSVEAASNADLMLMLGTSFPYNDFLPDPGRCVVIQVDQDPHQIGKRYPVNLGLCADVHRVVPELLARCRRHENRRWLSDLQVSRSEWNKLMERQATSDRQPMRPQVMARALKVCAAEDAIIVTDSGANTVWMARNFFVNGRQRFIGSGLMGTMQCGLPYAIGAKFACPDKQVIAGLGDGDFVMCMGEFTTAVHYELPIVVCIFNNSKLGLIKYEEAVAGVPEFGIHFHNPDFVKFAEACGGFGVRVEDPKDAEDAVRAALASGKPALIDAIVEPNEVPFPPKVERGQATGFGIAFLREQFAKIIE